MKLNKQCTCSLRREFESHMCHRPNENPILDRDPSKKTVALNRFA